MNTTKKATLLAAAVGLALTMTACTTDGGATTATEGATLSSAAQTALNKAYEGIGGTTLDSLEATTPKAGVKFYVMSCGESNSTCAAPSAAMKDAATQAGWDATIVDGKLSPEGFSTAIRQAVAAGANVLVPIGINCSAAQAAFQEAKAAGVTIVGGGGIDDCEGGVWDANRLWLEDAPVETTFHAIGMLQADYTFGITNGDVKAVVVNMTSNPWGSFVTDAYKKELDSLGGGTILNTVDISDPESADGSYIQKIVSVLLANQDVNALVMPTDAYLVNGLSAAIAQAGLADKITVMGGFGSEAAVDMIRDKQPGITATVGQAQEWEAWGSVDTAIRILNDQKPVFIGQQMQVVDADHNLPASGPYNGSIDWKSKFLTSWGK